MCILATTSSAYADRVVSCHDGDTCRVEASGNVFKVRFWGIDAPESTQPFGQAAQQRLMSLVDGQNVTTTCYGKSYDRKTCDVYVNGQDVSAILVQEGYAWDYPKFSKGKYRHLQEQAMIEHRGLWGTADLKSPFCWRWPNKEVCHNPEYEP